MFISQEEGTLVALFDHVITTNPIEILFVQILEGFLPLSVSVVFGGLFPPTHCVVLSMHRVLLILVNMCTRASKWLNLVIITRWSLSQN